MLNNETLEYSYYGSLESIVPLRPFSEDAVKESKEIMFQEMREMEERIKRHITECKHEVIKNILCIMKHERQIENKIKESEVCLKKKLKKPLTKN